MAGNLRTGFRSFYVSDKHGLGLSSSKKELLLIIANVHLDQVMHMIAEHRCSHNKDFAFVEPGFIMS